MLIAKMVRGKRTMFVELVKQGPVQFDPRPGWVLCRDVQEQPRFAELFWVHPDEVRAEWVREFTE